MPAPLIPLAIGFASLAACALGVKKGIDAKKNMTEAEAVNRSAQNKLDAADRMLDGLPRVC